MKQLEEKAQGRLNASISQPDGYDKKKQNEHIFRHVIMA